MIVMIVQMVVIIVLQINIRAYAVKNINMIVVFIDTKKHALTQMKTQ